MDELPSGGHSGSGNPENSATPLRIFTRVNSSGGVVSGEQTPDEASPRPREGTNALLSSAFSQPYEETGNAAALLPAGARAGAKAAPRAGRYGAHYHPLPSHWRELESGSSGIGSPVTPEGAGDDLMGVSRTVGPSSGISSQALQNNALHGGEAPRPYHSPRDYYQVKGKMATTTGQSPVASPRLHIGTLREAFGSTSSLDWPNDRPESSYSCQSTDHNGPGYFSEIQAESPLDIPAHGGRFPPALSSMAARPSAGRSVLGAQSGNSTSRHQPSGSSLSSHHSFGVSSPPLRNAGPAGSQFSVPKEATMPPGIHGEDIVRKYFGLQRRAVSAANSNGPASVDDIAKSQQVQMQRQRQQHRLSSTPSITGVLPQELGSQTGLALATLGTTGSTSPDDVSSGSIVFRRAVSSGDLPTLDESDGHDTRHSGSVADSRSFLTADLVESPLEALVRRLTIELFQLYVNEDRKKTAEKAQDQSQQQQQLSTVKSNASSQFAEEDEFVLVGTKAAAVAVTPGDGYIQQFRLGPSMRSGSNTPAVTMDGYFDPQASVGVEAGAGTGEARARPRHRLVQRTWMEEALIKARRVSTIDENAEEAILQGLDHQEVEIGSSGFLAPSAAAATYGAQKTPSPPFGSSDNLAQFLSLDSAVPVRIAQRGQALGTGRISLAGLSEEPLDGFSSGGAHVMSPRGFYRARDPAAPHRKQPAERRVRGHQQQSASISPARASLIRAVGRRQSVRLQPGKGQIVVAETHALGDQGAAAAAKVSERAKRANSLPGVMQVPETREVSYADLQRKAARAVAVKRTRMVHRAERMVLGGTGSATEIRKTHMHKRAGSRADMDHQLLSIELPPPVPLRVRREPVRMVAEPLIIVRRAARAVKKQGGEEQTPEERIQRVHNQLLGAQAVLSRHNSVLRHVRKEAVAMEGAEKILVDNALEDHLVDGDKQRFALDRSREPGRTMPWRNARRRSTLRKKEAALLPVAPPTLRQRRLLLHGPAYRIYSGIRARPDTYLFLFSDLLVVTTRLGADLHSPTMAAVMAPPSPDANIVPADSRFKVHIVIPLAPSTTSLKTTREGASSRPGEDSDAEEKRLVRQEERIRRACLVFEKNTSEAVVYLINREIIEPVPDTVAGFLYRCTALSRRQIGSFLGTGILGENLHENPTPDEVEQEKLFHRQIWAAFLDRCNIVGVPIDEALRSVLFYVRLPNSPMSISVLLEIAALQWFAKNQSDHVAGVYVPESQDVAVKLAFAIMTLNTELHNPLLRSDSLPDAAYRDLVLKFRASVVDDPAVAAKRKGNVLRKRDQPRVMTIMEVPADILKAIFDRVAANRLVTCSDARPAAAEFDVEWIRDITDTANALPLTDEQIEAEIEDVYCDPGFRDGVLFNASSDRLPAKFNVDPPAWVRVTVRIPEPDAKLTITIRALSVPAEPSSAGDAAVVAIVPSNRLSFRTSNAASFVIRPQQVGHFTLHFISEGSHARYYHPIPSRTMVVEGLFMRQTIQLAWKRPEEPVPQQQQQQQSHRARHMFGMDSLPTKSHWVRCIDSALKDSADLPSNDALRNVERATQALAALDQQAPSSSAALDQSISCQQLVGAFTSL
ncbi:hypothetical protein GGI20_000104 [Coemansia sp. BCRC 34301]|nr:hypothetical protein GGI20_000104 [Coemansia sp. BCRC 34301]